MNVEVMSVQGYLDEAAGLIRESGWITAEEQNALPARERVLNDRLTLYQAIEAVVPWDGVTPGLVFAELNRRAHDAFEEWAERDERTVADVLDLLA